MCFFGQYLNVQSKKIKHFSICKWGFENKEIKCCDVKGVCVHFSTLRVSHAVVTGS